MLEYGGFEHNLQSLRVVDELEERYAQFRGLNLTFVVPRRHPQALLVAARARVGNSRALHPAPPARARGADANLADEIAYNNHDVDDGIRAQLLDLSALREVRMFRRQHDAVAALYPIWASAAWCTRPSGA